MVDALRKVYQYEGVPGLYRGFVPGILGVSHGALQFMAYEELKKYYIQKHNLEADAKLGTMAYLSCAALSKLFAASITYPYQVLRARLQDQHNSYTGVIDVIKKTWRLVSILLTNCLAFSLIIRHLFLIWFQFFVGFFSSFHWI